MLVEAQRRLHVLFCNGTAVRATSQVGEDALGAWRFFSSSRRTADEDAIAAGRGADARDVVRPFDHRGADLRRSAHHVDFLAVTQCGLPNILTLRRTFAPGEADIVRAGGDLDVAREPGVDDRFHVGERFALVLVILWTTDREHFLTVDCDDEGMRRVVAFNSDVSLFHAAEQASRQLVFPVGREDVTHHDAAAGAERQSFDVRVLAELAADRVLGRCGRRLRVSNGERADALRCGDIAIKQQRRGLQRRRDVVESVVGIVTGQQGSDVYVDREQIAHGVAVLGTV